MKPGSGGLWRGVECQGNRDVARQCKVSLADLIAVHGNCTIGCLRETEIGRSVVLAILASYPNRSILQKTCSRAPRNIRCAIINAHRVQRAGDLTAMVGLVVKELHDHYPAWDSG